MSNDNKDPLEKFKELFKNKKYRDLEISLMNFLQENKDNKEALLLLSLIHI